MENKDYKVEMGTKIVAKNANICKFFSFVGYVGILLAVIAIALAIVGFNAYEKDLTNATSKFFIPNFDNYLERVFHNPKDIEIDDWFPQQWHDYKLTGIDNGFKYCLIVGVVLAGLSFLGTMITAIVIACYNSALERKYHDSVLVLAIVSIFFGIFTGMALNRKVDKIMEGKNYFAEEQADAQRQNNLQDNRVDFTNQKDVDNITLKLQNILKLKNEGLINEIEYLDLKDKIIKEA